MTALAGVFCLALAFCAALLTAIAGFGSAWRGRPTTVLRWPALTCLAAVAGCVACLEWALVRHDFSVQFVAMNGSRETPLYYTVTSLWAAHDGSLLLWNLVLAGYLFFLCRRARRGAEHLHGWAAGIVACVAAFFLGLALFGSHVFDRVSPVPSDGPGPTPLLADHPAMGIHPPLLYLGLVGLVVPFGYAAAALISGDTGGAWSRAAGMQLRLAWTALTAGIVLGAWWSYAVLGWGGYWSWDPVENASLMPWLLATALVHSLMLQRRYGALPAWNLALAVLAFLLAAVGVVLTRSGVVASVHSFADSAVGPVLLGFVAAAAATVLTLAIARSGGPPTAGPVGTAGALTRGTALLLNNLVLVALTVTVLLGTLAPVVVEAVTGERLSVGPPYYDRMAVPIALVLLVLMIVGPLLPWRRGDLLGLLRSLAVPVVIGAGVVVAAVATGHRSTGGDVALGLAAVAAASIVGQVAGEVRHHRGRTGAGAAGTLRWLGGRRRVLGGRVAHLGVAVLVVGVAASSAYSVSAERQLGPGEELSVGDTTVTLVSVGRARDARMMRTSAELTLTDGSAERTIRPELRFFPSRDTTIAAPAVVSGITGDVYVTVLSVRQDGGGALVRVTLNPMVGWIWAGGVLLVLGSLLGLGARRRTTNPPRRDAARTTVAAGDGAVPG